MGRRKKNRDKIATSVDNNNELEPIDNNEVLIDSNPVKEHARSKDSAAYPGSSWLTSDFNKAITYLKNGDIKSYVASIKAGTKIVAFGTNTIGYKLAVLNRDYYAFKFQNGRDPLAYIDVNPLAKVIEVGSVRMFNTLTNAYNITYASEDKDILPYNFYSEALTFTLDSKNEEFALRLLSACPDDMLLHGALAENDIHDFSHMKNSLLHLMLNYNMKNIVKKFIAELKLD